jgi:hypothetical protein
MKIHDNGTRVYGSSGQVGHGLYIRGSNNIFDKIEAYNNGDLGMQFYSSVGGVNNNIVRNSIFRNNGVTVAGGGGLYIGSGDGNIAYNNISYNNPGAGISVGSGQINSKVYNNTVYNNGHGGIIVSSGSGAVIRNSIIWSNGSAYGNLADYGSGTIQSNNLMTNPIFVDAASSNFRLQSGSPAIDKGANISIVTNDFDGHPRPQGAGYDIGACEFGQLISPLIPSPPNFRIVSQ